MPQKHQTSPYFFPAASAILRAFESFSRARRQLLPGDDFLSTVAESIVDNLSVDRCLLFLLDKRPRAAGSPLRFSLLAEKCGADWQTTGVLSLTYPSASPTSQRLASQKHVYLSRDSFRSVSIVEEKLVRLPELRNACPDESILLFPLSNKEELIGLLCFTFGRPDEAIPPVLIEFGEFVAGEIADAISQESFDAMADTTGEGIEQEVVNLLLSPSLVVDKTSGAISAINMPITQLMGLSREELIGLEISKLFENSDQIVKAIKGINRNAPEALLDDTSIQKGRGDFAVSTRLLLLQGRTTDQVLVTLSKVPGSGTSKKTEKPEADPALTLTKQINWERWARQLVCKLHTTTDKDVLLQTAVDYVGKWLRASRCFIARTTGAPPYLVTHEYAEPDISPLGLGRTDQFPQAILERIKHHTYTLNEPSAFLHLDGMSEQDFKILSEYGITSLVGTPIILKGGSYGALIVLHSLPRQWAREDIDSLTLTAEQTAIALERCESLQHFKDKLFNMDMLGNLAEQLNNALENVRKGVKAAGVEEKSATGSVPLSFRELEVLKLIASGYANREVAQRLFLTESTVELHASRIRKKLNLKSRTALVKYACDHNLV